MYMILMQTAVRIIVVAVVIRQRQRTDRWRGRRGSELGSTSASTPGSSDDHMWD